VRVLAIDEELPYPPDSGKRIRTFELLRRLARDFEIVLAFHAPGAVPAEAQAAFDASGIRLLPVPRAAPRKRGLRFGLALFRNLFTRAPYMVMAHRSDGLRHAVRETAAALQPDLIHVEWTPLLANVPEDVAVPVCISAHNVEAQIFERYVAHVQGRVARAYLALQLRKIRRFEKAAFGAARSVIAVSEADSLVIRGLGARQVSVVPNGVDAEAFTPRPGSVEPGTVLFTGSLDWRPNLDGLGWFLAEVWGRVRAEESEATFLIVGRRPPRRLAEQVAGLAGVTLHASVPEIPPYVARAAVCVVPLRVGGGSRLKIPEALAMERPVVSTTVGAEGLQLEDTVTLADGPEEFAAAIVRHLRDPRPNTRGRELVLQRYTWDRIAPLQAAAWRAAAAR